MTDEIHPLPINGELDLHTFRPRDVGSLVPEYLAECRARGILTVRLIHGKGTGALRQTVHAILKRQPDVLAFTLASEPLGGWGATLVRLRPAIGETAPPPPPAPV
jgi:DNA-nicking Smr family endonuclease